MSKNDNKDIELNAYGEKIAPKNAKNQKQTKSYAPQNVRKPQKNTAVNNAGRSFKNTRKPILPSLEESFVPKAAKKTALQPSETRRQSSGSTRNEPIIHPETGKPLHTTNHRSAKKTPLKIIPLGGLNEIGKNMTVFECANDIFIVDCGLA
ncbi:MAG: hypothetical protein K2H23_02005, partial [Oscillospiraceae bacterium]|nr:hypothetical protein [Oscillospiraceae bacterium]